jgi:hypothetical protein
VSFFGLFSPSIVNSWLLAARLGFAGVVALWLVVWLLFLRRTGAFQVVPTAQKFSAQGPKRDVSKGAAEPPPTLQTPTVGKRPADAEVGGQETPATGSPFAPAAPDDAPVVDEPEDTAGGPRRGTDDK